MLAFLLLPLAFAFPSPFGCKSASKILSTNEVAQRPASIPWRTGLAVQQVIVKERNLASRYVTVQNVLLNESEYLAMFRSQAVVDDDDDDGNASFDPMIVVYGEAPGFVASLEGAPLATSAFKRLPDGRLADTESSVIYANAQAAAGSYGSVEALTPTLPLLATGSPLWRPTGEAAEYVPAWAAAEHPTLQLHGGDASPRILRTPPSTVAYLYLEQWDDDLLANALDTFEVVSTPAFGSSGARSAGTGDASTGLTTLTISLVVVGSACALAACCCLVGCVVLAAVRRRRQGRAQVRAALATHKAISPYAEGSGSRRVSRRPSRSVVRRPSGNHLALVLGLISVVAAQWGDELVSGYARATVSDLAGELYRFDLDPWGDGPGCVDESPATLRVVIYSTTVMFNVASRTAPDPSQDPWDFSIDRAETAAALSAASYELIVDRECVNTWTCPSLVNLAAPLKPFTEDEFGLCAYGHASTLVTDDDDYAAFVSVDPTDRVVYVAVKGTSTTSNIVSDINARMTTDGGLLSGLLSRPLFDMERHAPDARVHAGFLGAAEDVARWLADSGEPTDVHDRWTNALIDTVAAAARCASMCQRVAGSSSFSCPGDGDTIYAQPWNVVLTGHSMGGAIATLLALHLSLRAPFSPRYLSVYTQGGPRVGNAQFAQFVAEQVPAVYRIVNRYDPFTQVPFAIEAINFFGGRDPIEDGYRHTGTEFWWHGHVDESWALSACLAGPASRLNLESECCSVMAVKWRELTGMLDAVGDHYMARYTTLEPSDSSDNVVAVLTAGLDGRAHHCGGWREPGSPPVPTDYPDPDGLGGFAAPTQLSVLMTDSMVRLTDRVMQARGDSMRIAAFVSGLALATPFVSDWDRLMGFKLEAGAVFQTETLALLPQASHDIYCFVATGAQLRALLTISLAQRCTSFFLHWSGIDVAYTQSDADARDVRIDSLTWSADGAPVGDAEEFLFVTEWDLATGGMYGRFLEDLLIYFGDPYGRSKLSEPLRVAPREARFTSTSPLTHTVNKVECADSTASSLRISLEQCVLYYVAYLHDLYNKVDIPQAYVDSRLSRTLVDSL